jgi:transposase
VVSSTAAEGCHGEDLTLEEIRNRLKSEKKLQVAVNSVWRFYDRNEITFLKKVLHAAEQDRPDVAAARGAES